MKRLSIVSAIILLVFCLSISVHAAQFSFSPDDLNILPVDTPMGPWSPDGSVADITYNQTNGTLYALASDGIYQYGIAQKVQNVTIPSNMGGELAIGRNGEVALLQQDLLPVVHLFESIENFETNFDFWFINDAVDIAFDQDTGNLFALTLNGVFQYGSTNVYGEDLDIETGGDIAIGPDGKFAISPSDDSKEVMLYDSNWGSIESWAPDGAVADIAFDLATGDLYAFNEGGVYRMSDSDPIPTFPTAAFNDGGDMAIYSTATVPIPSSMLLLVSGIVGLVAFRRRVQKS